MATWDRILKAHNRLETFFLIKEETSIVMFYICIVKDK